MDVRALQVATTDPLHQEFASQDCWSEVIFIVKLAKKTLGMPLRWKIALILLVILFAIIAYFAFSNKGEWKDWLSTLTMSGGRDTTVTLRRGDEIPQKMGLAPLVDLPYLGDGWGKLGFFNVKLYDMRTKTTYRIEFELEGETIFGDKKEFQKFMDSNYRLLREQVGVTVRAIDQTDLIDPEHKVLSWKLANRINRVFGYKVLNEVKLDKFDVYSSIEGSGYVKCELQTPGM